MHPEEGHCKLGLLGNGSEALEPATDCFSRARLAQKCDRNACQTTIQKQVDDWLIVRPAIFRTMRIATACVTSQKMNEQSDGPEQGVHW